MNLKKLAFALFVFTFAIFLAACGGGGGGGSTPTPVPDPPAPSISSLSPTHGQVGTAVTIDGAHFGASPTVKFNGTVATVASGSTDAVINTTVPSDATTGAITVTTADGTTSSTFTVDPPPAPTVAWSQKTAINILNQPLNVSITATNTKSCQFTIGPSGPTSNQALDLPIDPADSCKLTGPIVFRSLIDQPTYWAYTVTITVTAVGLDGKTTAQDVLTVNLQVPCGTHLASISPTSMGPNDSTNFTIKEDNSPYGTMVQANGGYPGTEWASAPSGSNNNGSGASTTWIDPHTVGVGVECHNCGVGIYTVATHNHGAFDGSNVAGGNCRSVNTLSYSVVASSSNVVQASGMSVQLVGNQKAGSSLSVYDAESKLAGTAPVPSDVQGIASDGKFAYMAEKSSSSVLRFDPQSMKLEHLLLPDGFTPTLAIASPDSPGSVYVATRDGTLLHLQPDDTFKALTANIRVQSADIAVDGKLVVLSKDDPTHLEVIQDGKVSALIPVSVQNADRIKVVNDSVAVGKLGDPSISMVNLDSGAESTVVLTKGLWNFARQGKKLFCSSEQGDVQLLGADGTISNIAHANPADLPNGFAVTKTGMLVAGRNSKHLMVQRIAGTASQQ